MGAVDREGNSYLLPSKGQLKVVLISLQLGKERGSVESVSCRKKKRRKKRTHFRGGVLKENSQGGRDNREKIDMLCRGT